jgi:excisionase family DNA binding protein
LTPAFEFSETEDTTTSDEPLAEVIVCAPQSGLLPSVGGQARKRSRRFLNLESTKMLMERSISDREPLLTTAAVAKWLGVATRTICLWAECREIPAMKVGRQWRFRAEDLRQWLHSPQGGKVTNSTAVKATGAAV